MDLRLRRQFLTGLVKASALALSTPYLMRMGHGQAVAQSAVPNQLRLDSERVFDLSVASGDPSPSGVILWTHLRRTAVTPGMPLYFQVATDGGFNNLVLEGEVPASAITADHDWTVRVDLNGQLAAGTRYYFRFIYDATASRTGRCRTLPTGHLASAQLAVLSCQDYTNGYYGAFRHLAADDNVDFVLHLGDFIYESAADPRFQSLPFADRELVLPSGETVAFGLEDYRYLYRTYRSDPDMQRLMEQHTLIIVQDDHETANDCYWDYGLDTLGAPDHPLVAQPNALRALKLAAQQAWLEYVPARVDVNPDAQHPHDYFTMYRGFELGDLIRLNMIDTRTYRTAHPCGEGDVFQRYVPVGCTNYKHPDQSMLGTNQAKWLLDSLEHSTAVWNVVGNQTFFGALSIAGTLPLNVDAWDGYEAERNWLTQQIVARNVRNLVVLTGDLHSYIASTLKRDYRNLNPFDVGNLIGVEFMTPAVTSAGLLDQLTPDTIGANLANGLTEAAIRLNNPHIRYFNSSRHGYSTVRFTRDYCEWTAYAVDKNVVGEHAARSVVARYRKYVSWPFLVERPI